MIVDVFVSLAGVDVTGGGKLISISAGLETSDAVVVVEASSDALAVNGSTGVQCLRLLEATGVEVLDAPRLEYASNGLDAYLLKRQNKKLDCISLETVASV